MYKWIVPPRNDLSSAGLSFSGLHSEASGVQYPRLREASWSAAAKLPPFVPEFHGGSFAAALQGAFGTLILRAGDKI
jgi:hypothetical protein